MEKALKIKIIFSTIVICGVITALALALVNKYTPSETMRPLDNYYDVAPEEAVVLLENEIYGERALLRDGGIYLSLNTIDSSGQAGISSWINVDLSTRPTFSDVERMIIDTIDKNNKKQEKEEMKGFNFDFGPCTGDQVRMSMYGLAVKNAAGTYVSYNPKSGEIVDVDVLNFDGAKFMYKIPVAIKEIAVGDIIVHNRKPMFVTALPAEGTTAITCVDVCAGEQKHVIPTVNMFGFNFVTKIVSLFNTVGDNAPTPDAPFGNMLPFMLMNEGTDKIDPMMMMFMMGGKMDMSNPMMMYFMLKDNKDTDMLPLLFMMQNK
jgi:hypothetical protein